MRAVAWVVLVVAFAVAYTLSVYYFGGIRAARQRARAYEKLIDSCKDDSP